MSPRQKSTGEREERIHRTWTKLLLDRGHRELASIAVESEIGIVTNDFGGEHISLRIPPSAHEIVDGDEQIRGALLGHLREVCAGHIFDQDYNSVQDVHIETKMSLLGIDPDWREEMRRLISEAKGSNQGVVTEKQFGRDDRETYTYNEMTFGSKSEIRVAQELETRDVLFFPLPLGVRAETGDRWKDRREPDFLVCQDGTWGILEVAYHPDRYEKDAEKATWFKEAGILCVEHATAERCYNHPADVVDDFLNVLSKHQG